MNPIKLKNITFISENSNIYKPIDIQFDKDPLESGIILEDLKIKINEKVSPLTIEYIKYTGLSELDTNNFKYYYLLWKKDSIND